MAKALIAVGVMLLAFLAGVPIAVVAIGGAACSLLTRRVKPEKVYREVNWSLLVLFVGLFVLTGALEASGLAAELAVGRPHRTASAHRADGRRRAGVEPRLQRARRPALQAADPGPRRAGPRLAPA